MCGKQSGDQIQNRLRLQHPNDAQDLQFLRDVQPVAAFHFERGCAVCGELVEKGSRPFCEGRKAGLPNPPRGGLNPAAGARDFLVGPAAQAQFVIVRPAGGEY